MRPLPTTMRCLLDQNLSLFESMQVELTVLGEVETMLTEGVNQSRLPSASFLFGPPLPIPSGTDECLPLRLPTRGANCIERRPHFLPVGRCIYLVANAMPSRSTRQLSVVVRSE